MTLKEAKALLSRYDQLQLLQYYDELDGDKKARLLEEISKIDFTVTAKVAKDVKKPLGKLSPADALTLEEIAAEKDRFEEIGLNALKQGIVAAVLLAGGQGTRLGFDAPKGTFNIGVTQPLSIFECQMRNLKSVAEKAGAYPHLFVMTSTLNDVQTREFFKAQGYFGYPKEKIHFYVQNVAPAISFDGKILLEEKHLPVLTPNGNGGWYISLKNSDVGKVLKKEGIKWLNVYGVDNVLQKICDPVFIGATILSGMACGGKVVKKANPEERVGVLCKEDGLPAIVEYYEMPQDKAVEKEANGELKYRFGVILNYLFSIEKLDGAGLDKLPYHMAEKKVSFIEDGKKVTPEKPNAYKLESLAVDIIKLMGSCLGFEVEREREFAPVKNKTGVDSVESARALLIKNGIKI